MGKRKGKSSGGNTSRTVIAAALAVIAVLGLFMYLGGDGTYLSVGDSGVSTEEVLAAASSSEFCANNPALDAEVRLKDMLATSTTYKNGTLYIKDVDSGAVTEHSVIGGGSSDFTTLSDVFDCNSEAGYEIYVKLDGASSDPINSDGVVVVPASELTSDPVRLDTIMVSGLDNIKVKVYDNDDKSKAVDALSGSTDYVQTLTSEFNASNGNPFAGTADASLDLTFTYEANTSSRAFGNGFYIAVNTEDEANVDDWDEDSLELSFDGVALSEASDIPSNDIRALTGYEKIYKVEYGIGTNAAGDRVTEHDMDFKISTTAGNAADFDPVIRLVALGDFLSDDDDSVVLQGVGFRDDTSRTQLGNTVTQTIAVN